MTPTPGSEADPGDAATITVQFHKDVVADESQFSLVGDVDQSDLGILLANWDHGT